MAVLQYVQRLFSLDTLDPRFSTSSKALPATEQPLSDNSRALPNDSGQSLRSPRDASTAASTGPQTSKWKSSEFMVYSVVVLTAILLMFKSGYDVSNPSHPNFFKFGHLLSPGWIPGRKFDNTDQQYAGFRENIPYLFLLLILHPLLRRAFEYLQPTQAQANGVAFKDQPKGVPRSQQDQEGDARKTRRLTFDLIFSLLYIFALHGTSAFKILVILYINYTLATQLSREAVPVATWTFNIAILFANELCRGYSYVSLANFVTPSSGLRVDQAVAATEANWGSLLDSYGGLIPRWEVLFNITILRLISFNLDYYWSRSRSGSNILEKKQLDPSNLSERDRVEISAQNQDYSFGNYLAYILYAPLYLAGPILTFNDYICQSQFKAQSLDTRRTTYYGFRFLISLLTMEVMLHFIYVVAISKAQPAWEMYSPFQVSMIGYFNLHIIWLKLLLPWRFFRLWALVDGIDPPENMVRCMSDNYSTLAFWRGWHRSFNRWIVRYIYIPLGGSGGPSTQGRWGSVRAIGNMLVVFTFVALWHDIQLRLLLWGWLVTLFVLPEVLAGLAFPKRKWQNRQTAYRVICGVGAVGNILMMMAANLVGFAIGFDGLKGLVHGIVGSYSGILYLLIACATLFVGAQVMFEHRAGEMRQGIKMKC